ncbi:MULTISPECIES: cytochrome P450 [unclassified Streptomyces]|uniref:cytochrome P450 family protein n=1 Tax=unclassified Streptomyces TaxID=2593676 RepID=UPI00224FE2E5|nr:MULTISPECIES: cytochrome P450 [unclassified Streptomyces]MCX4524147.1 cytochrome P450 [Streptomyces sp. NBC_01551]MCX4545334.1 cytochrome P450 [Streptomyces sp. NBC_01565]
MATLDHQTSRDALGHALLSKDAVHWQALTDGRIPPDWELGALIQGAGMLHAGGAAHARLRGLVSSAFRRASVEAMRPRIEEIASVLLDRLESAGADEAVDLREEFAWQLPVEVICELLGIPVAAAARLRGAFDRLVTPQPSESSDQDGVLAAQMTIAGELAQLIALKRENPGADLATELIRARDADDDRLSDQELVQTMFLLLIAGQETTVALITGTVHSLLSDPSQVAAVVAGTHTWADAVEEGLRHSSPVRYALMRYATEDVQIGGVTIEKGEPVIAALFAAGRDPQVHENADRFDLDRAARHHLAFGHGSHYCLGANLARLEAEVALGALFARFPGLALADEAPTTVASIPLQGLQNLPVRLQGRGALLS